MIEQEDLFEEEEEKESSVEKQTALPKKNKGKSIGTALVLKNQDEIEIFKDPSGNLYQTGKEGLRRINPTTNKPIERIRVSKKERLRLRRQILNQDRTVLEDFDRLVTEKPAITKES